MSKKTNSKNSSKNSSFKTGFQKFFVALLGNEKRQNFTIPFFAIFLSLVAASIIILMVGKNPLQAFYSLLQGSGFAPKPAYAGSKGMLTDFMSFLNYLTPMIFAALSVAVAFKAGLFNIGVSGQMLAAGFTASVLVGYTELDSIIARPLVLIIGLLVGALVGAIIGWLKHKFNINEVVSSIMLNYIIQYIVSFCINLYFMDPVSRQSYSVSDESRLTITNYVFGDYKMDVPLGIILALITAFIIHFLLEKTKIGYEIKTVGANPKAAQYAGIKVGANRVLAMTISGALAGLAGVTYYLGYTASIRPRVLADTGFDAIAVSLLGNSNPIAIIFSSTLITIIDKGSTYMSSTVDIDQEFASLITGMLLLFSACGAYIKHLHKQAQDNLEFATKEVQVAENVDDKNDNSAKGGA